MRILRVGSMCIYQRWWYESRPLRKYARVSDLLSSVRGPARETYILCFSQSLSQNEHEQNIAKVRWLIIIQADDLHVEISALWVKAHRTDCLAQPSFMQCLDPCSFDQSKHSFSVIVCTCILIIWLKFDPSSNISVVGLVKSWGGFILSWVADPEVEVEISLRVRGSREAMIEQTQNAREFQQVYK